MPNGLQLPSVGERLQGTGSRQRAGFATFGGGEGGPSLLSRELSGLARFTSSFFRGALELARLPFSTATAIARGRPPSELPITQAARGILESGRETGRDIARAFTPGGRSELAQKIRDRSLVEVVGEDALNILGGAKVTGAALRRAGGGATALSTALERPIRTLSSTVRRRVSAPALARAARGQRLTLLERAATLPERRALAGRVRGEIIEGIRDVGGAAQRTSTRTLRRSVAQLSAQVANSPRITPLLRGVNPRVRTEVIRKAVGEAHTDLAQGPGRILAELSRRRPDLASQPTVLRRLLPEDITSFTDRAGRPIPELNRAKEAIRREVVTDPALSARIVSNMDRVRQASEDLLALTERSEGIRVKLGGKPRLDEVKAGELVFSRQDINKRVRPALAQTDPTIALKEGRKWVVPEGVVANQARALLEADKLTGQAARIIRPIFEKPALKRVDPRWQPLVQSTRKLADDLRDELQAAGMKDDAIRRMIRDDYRLPQTMNEVVQLAVTKGFDPIFVPDLARAQVNRLMWGHPTLGSGLLGRVGEAVVSGRAKPRARILQSRNSVVQDVADSFDAAITEVTAALRSNEVAKFADQIAFDIPKVERVAASGATVREKALPPGWQAYDPVARVAGTDATFVRQPHVTRMIPDSMAREMTKWNKLPSAAEVRVPGYDTFTDGWRTAVLTMSPRWYCVPDTAEALTRDGWKTHDQLSDGDEICAFDPATDSFAWAPATISRFEEGPDKLMYAGGFLSTEDHRWPVRTQSGVARVKTTSELAVTDYLLRVDRVGEVSYACVGEVSYVPHGGMVWCPTTPTGFWLMRQNGKLVITHNTNNIIGNVLLATTQGVRLSDWSAAWQALRKGGAPFEKALRAPEGFLESFFPGGIEGANVRARLGSSTLIRTEAGLLQRPGIAGTFGAEAKRRLQQISQANFFVDVVARTAAFKSLRRRGQTLDQAVRGANRLMVDYMDMTPFQRAYVRRVFPFFAWQKGILKVATRLPVDHPARTAAFYLTGKTLGGWTDNERDNYPAFLYHSIPLSTLGPLGAGISRLAGGGDPSQDRLMTRGANPFADSLALSTPEGIASSLNPIADWFIRGVMQRPSSAGVFTQKLDVSSGGFLVPEYDWFREGLLVFRDLPLSRLTLNALGQRAQINTGRTAPSLGLEFAGVRVRTPEEIARAVERTIRARETAATRRESFERSAQRRSAGLARSGRGAGGGIPTLSDLLSGS